MANTLTEAIPLMSQVSVPLPGFSGLRLVRLPLISLKVLTSFSPVAGIQWVETELHSSSVLPITGFSPVAGIQWVETICISQSLYAFCEVSVPLPGFSGLRH